jgi:hypothetical protein
VGGQTCGRTEKGTKEYKLIEQKKKHKDKGIQIQRKYCTVLGKHFVI